MFHRFPLLTAPILLTACSDYEFTDSLGSSPGDDTAEPARPGDGGGGDPDEDPCWEPEDGYELNPAARLVVESAEEAVTVTFLFSDTSYQDTLVLDAPDAIFLVDAWADPVGTSFSLGPYPPEVELIFGVDVLDTGAHWQSGPASRNSDGVVHGGVTYEGDCSWLMGFEDLTGGGDLDYNDVMLRVQGPLRQDL